MRFLQSIKDFIRDFPRQFLAFCVSLLIVSGTGVYAATSYDVHNVPQMYLSVGIDETQTTGIRISGPVINTVRGNFPTTSGGVLEISYGDYREHIYYDRATVNNTTKEITLTSGVIRDLYWNDCTQYTGDGTGRKWGKSAYVRLVDDCRLLNRKAATDRANTFTASGATRYSGSGSLGWPTFATTAERDRQLGANPPPGIVRTACVTGTGLCYHYIGGAWTAFGNTGVGNADETTAGKVELATIADQVARTAEGSAGPLVLQAKYLTNSGSIHGVNGSIHVGRVPMLNSSGSLSVTVGGTGLVNPGSGSVLMGAGSGKLKLIAPGTANNVLVSNGSTWASGVNPTYCKPVYISAEASAPIGIGTNGVVTFGTHSYIIPAGDLVNGVVYRYQLTGSGTWNTGGNLDVRAKLDSTELSVITWTPNAAFKWQSSGQIFGTAAAGASVKVRDSHAGFLLGGTLLTYINTADALVATNGALTLTFAARFGVSNAGNSNSLFGVIIERCSTTAS